MTMHEQRAGYVLRGVALERMAAALSRPALLVKGAALALDGYAQPWRRTMIDVDLLVPSEDAAAALVALERTGARLQPVPVERRWSFAAFAERTLILELGGAELAIELHTGLDKIVQRPVDVRAIMARARAAPGLAPLLLPSPEDHALLLVQHAAAADFAHAHFWNDIELLIARGLDLAAIERRARAWRLELALHAALDRLAARGSPALSAAGVEELRARVRPSNWRRRWYERSGPAPDAAARVGWRWVLRQTALRSDARRWTLGVARYAAVRAVEHTLARYHRKKT